MPFCPNCRDEFQDWVTVCPDCGTKLVDKLPEEPPEEPEMPLVRRETPADIVHIATFSYPAEAHLAKAKLESEGIPAFVADEHILTANWTFSIAIGGIKLWVREEDAEAASQVLKYRETPDVAGQTEDSCPLCHSTDVHYEKYSIRPIFIAWLLLGFTFPFVKKKWVCRSCRNQWKE